MHSITTDFNQTMQSNDDNQIVFCFDGIEKSDMVKALIIAGRIKNKEKLNVTINDAAEIAGVGRHTMEEWVHRKINPIPHFYVGSRVYIPVSEIPAFIESLSIG